MTRSEDYKPRAVTDHRDMRAMDMMDDIGILKTPSLLTPPRESQFKQTLGLTSSLLCPTTLPLPPPP